MRTEPTSAPAGVAVLVAIAIAIPPATTVATVRIPEGAAQTCTVSERLVPDCDILWGAAAGAYSAASHDRALRDFEARTGRSAAVFHVFHTGDDVFPTPVEVAAAHEWDRRRILFVNLEGRLGYHLGAGGRRRPGRADRPARRPHP